MQNIFQSWFMGGFECATKRYADGRRIDIIGQSRHDQYCETDYRLLSDLGIRTIRDGLRWHLIEQSPGQYDWSSWLPMLEAAQKTGVQVIWDLVHWGAPDHSDMWSESFISQFADYARAAAEVFKRECDKPPIWCPINEISYWAFRATQNVWPHTPDSGDRIKRQLVKASLAGIHAVRDIDPSAIIMAVDPLVFVQDEHNPRKLQANAENWIYHTWDMLTGHREPELGGSANMVDIIGVNFYGPNEWHARGPEFKLSAGEWSYEPLHKLLRTTYERYGKPIVVSETGAEGDNGPGWMRYIAGEAMMAERAGIPVLGLCTYPAMDYPGWLDSRHCPCGFIKVDDNWQKRSYHTDTVLALREQQFIRTHWDEINRL